MLSLCNPDWTSEGEHGRSAARAPIVRTRQQALPPKKGAHRAGCCQQAGLRAPSRSHTEWFSLYRHTIISDTMSIRLVEGGLARVAGQSCLAGPSVCSTSQHVRFLGGPHSSFPRIRNKKASIDACCRRLAVVRCSGCTRAPVKIFARFSLMVRQPRAESKTFCNSRSPTPK